MNGDYPTNGGATSEDFIRRFERALDAQEKEFYKTREDVTGLKNQQAYIQRDLGTLTSSIQALSTKMDERAKTNWPALAIGAGLLPVLGFVLTMYTNNTVAPVANSASLNAENLRHISDNLRTVEATLSAEMSDRKSRDAALRVGLAEIETQFCASDVVRNLMHANDLRNFTMLWEKSFGTPYPISNAYYPEVCHHNGSPTAIGEGK